MLMTTDTVSLAAELTQLIGVSSTLHGKSTANNHPAIVELKQSSVEIMETLIQQFKAELGL